MNDHARRIGFAFLPVFAALALAAGDAPKPEAAASDAAKAPPPAAEAKEPKASRDARRMRDWVEDLGSPEYGVRRRAAEALRDAGEKAEPALKAALESDDPEVRWQAKMILQDLDDARAAEAKRAEEAKRLAEEAAQEKERRARAPRDRVARPVPPDDIERMIPGPMPGDFREMFREMDEIMRQMEVLRGEALRFDIPLPEGIPGAGGVPQKVEIEVWDNGQHAKYEEGVDGSVKARIEEDGKVKTFEAKSRAEFMKEHPDLAKRFGLAPGRAGAALRDPFGDLGFGPRIAIPRDRAIRRPRAEARAPAREEKPPAAEPARLGIGADEMPEALRAHLKVAAGQGLLVREVFPETLAERLGIERLDVLLKVAGKPVATPEDVSNALEGAKAGEDIEVEVLRAGERKALKGKR